MAGKLKILTDDDKRLLQWVIDEVRRQVINTPSRPPTERSWDEGEDHQAPEVYIAKPQDADGIPALEEGAGAGGEDVPGRATCDVYTIRVNASTGMPELHQVPGLKKEVFNLTGAVSQTWVTILRDKFGRWTPAIGAGGGNIVGFTIDAVNCDEGWAEVTIASRPCGMATVPEEYSGTLTVHDVQGCHLNEPEYDLVGRRGYAAYQQPADGSYGGCRWEIVSLCCAEDICG